MIDEDPYKLLFGRNLPESWHRPEKDIRRKGNTGDVAKSTIKKNSPEAPQKKQGDGFAASFSSTENSVDSPAATSPSMSGPNENSVFDPITMRRVPRDVPKSQKSSIDASNTSSSSVDIPVRIFGAHGAVSSKTDITSTKELPEQGSQEVEKDWLKREGFGNHQADDITKLRKDYAKSPKIETALDRYQKKPKSVAALELQEPEKSTALKYEPKEIKTDDIDLLTASDIRASAGRVSRAYQETPKERSDRRQSLEKLYEEQLRLEEQMEKEVAAYKVQSEHTLRKKREEVAKEQRKRDAVKKAHEEEVKTQKAAMEVHETRRNFVPEASPVLLAEHPPQGEGDMASNVHDFVSRDRWYKRKAPHANGVAEQKLLQATKDRDFVREIRSIYEDSYGTIDTKHRQLPPQTSLEASQYPSDAYPGTVYEQPWTANILNDHPDVEAGGVGLPPEQAELQSSYDSQNHEALSLIGRLFGEMRENQALLQEHREQLQALAAKDSSQSLYQKLRKHEQRIMQTLKAAQNLFKSTTALGATRNNVASNDETSGSASESTLATTSEESTIDKDTSAPPTLYKILAYDPSTQKVTSSKTTNVVGRVTGKPLSFSEALFGLENPAKFLSHLTALQTGEYEIAAGGPNLLIFKKIRQLKPSPEEKVSDDTAWPANPIDGMVAPTGNFASPTGFVNYDPPLPEPEPQSPPEEAANATKGNEKVRRQEEVFSGSSRRAWHDQYERGSNGKAKTRGKYRKPAKEKGTAKRMLLVGVLTATGCYAVGVASEFFRI